MKQDFSKLNGLTKAVVKALSRSKGEPAWMLDSRLKAFDVFEKAPMPPGVDIDLDALDFSLRPARAAHKEPDQEAAALSIRQELKKQGVVFLDMDEGLRARPALVRKHFGSAVTPKDGKFAALNTAFWSGGSFIYVPKGVKVDFPLQADLRIDSGKFGFERTLIVADQGASVHFIEGCSAPVEGPQVLHASVVELVALPNAHIRFTTIQNWSRRIDNIAAKRAIAHKDAKVQWLDANVGSRLTIKHPGVILAGPGARGEIFACALAGDGQRLDVGGELVFRAPRTSGKLVSRSVIRPGGEVISRNRSRRHAGLESECEALMLREDARFSAEPGPGTADVAQLDEEQVFYAMSRGMTRSEAITLISNGFFESFAKELPLEYAVEFNRLVQLELESAFSNP